MKYSAGWMIVALALCWCLAGCGKSQPAAPAEPEAAPATAEATPVAAPAAEVAEPALLDEALAAAVATVDGVNITEGEIQKVLGMFKKQMGGRIPPEQMAEALPRIRERIVEELIMRRVMLDEVAKQGVNLSDSEFEEIKAELVQELPPDTTLESYMTETGTTEAEMREQMAVRKMIMAKAESIEKPSEDEIQKFYEENKEGFAQGESVSAAHILIKLDPADDEAAKTAKRERLAGLRQQLLDGADFAELAKANSDCPSASSGGDLGSFGKGQMVPEFEDAAFSQPTGSVGDIVETQFGFHLIKVTEHNEAKTLDFNEAKDRISDIIYSEKQQDAVREFVDGLREKADIQRFDAPPAEETMLQLDVDEEEPMVLDLPVIDESGEVVQPAPDPAVAEAPVAVEAAAEVVEQAAEKIETVATEVVTRAEETAPAVAAAAPAVVEPTPAAPVVPAPAEEQAE